MKTLFFIPVLFWVSICWSQKKSGLASQEDVMILSKGAYDSLKTQLSEEVTAFKTLKHDSSELETKLKITRQKKHTDSLRYAADIHRYDTALTGSRTRLQKLGIDSTTLAETLERGRDSIKLLKTQITEKQELQRSAGELKGQIAAMKAKNKTRHTEETLLQTQYGALKEREMAWQDTIESLKKQEARLADIRANNAELKKQVWNNYDTRMSTLTSSTDFSEARIMSLEEQSHRLEAYYSNTPGLPASQKALAQFKQLAQHIREARDLLAQPFDPAACQNGITLLNNTRGFNSEQTTLVRDYGVALTNYCRLNWDCDSVAQRSVKYSSLGPDVAVTLLTTQLAKIDAKTYPFLYNELNRMLAIVTKKQIIESTSIPHIACR